MSRGASSTSSSSRPPFLRNLNDHEVNRYLTPRYRLASKIEANRDDRRGGATPPLLLQSLPLPSSSSKPQNFQPSHCTRFGER